MKKIVFSCVCMAAAVVSAGTKLGVVNLEILIKNHPSHESNRALVKSTADDYRKKMEARQEKAKALVDEGKKIQSDWQNPMLSAVAKADLQKQRGDGDAGRAGSVDDDPDIADFPAGETARIEQSRRRDDRRPVLVIVENRHIALLDQRFFNLETSRRGDILQIDSSEALGNIFYCLNDDFRIL